MPANNPNIFGPVIQDIFADDKARQYRRIKNAIWVFIYVIIFCNQKNGKLTTTIAEISGNTGFQEETVRTWLGILKKWHLISIGKQNKDVLIKVNQWRKIINKSEFCCYSEPHIPDKKPKPVKPMLPAEPQSMAEFLAKELDVADGLTSLIKICQENPHAVIEKAYQSYKEVPEKKITSKIGLLIYFIRKYAKQK